MAERAELGELLNIGRAKKVKTRPAKAKRTLFMVNASKRPNQRSRLLG
jgi:hypothetical protein